MARINADWHRANPMPANAKPDQRLAWHLAHAKACACRAIPDGVRKLMIERGVAVPVPKPDDSQR